ncbi:MAG: hypothetical protein WCB85_11980 [Candidatus Dormiibacterota bacterium]
MPGSGAGANGQDLQVVATAFEECARAFTTRGRAIASLAGELRGECAPLGDQSIGGSDSAALSSMAAAVAANLGEVGDAQCPLIAGGLTAVLAKFQEVDAGQAAKVPSPGGP